MSNRRVREAVRSIATILVTVLVMSTIAGCGGNDDTDETTTDGGGVTITQGETSRALPDFVIERLSVQPSGVVVTPGEVQISATVRNMGSGAYGGAIVVQAPDNHTGTITGGLAVGASGVAVIQFPVPSPNTTYTLSLIVDPDNIVGEESESNNESTTITITTSS